MKQVACERVWAREGGKDGKGHGLMGGGDSQCQGPGLAHVGAGEEASVDRRRKTGGRGVRAREAAAEGRGRLVCEDWAGSKWLEL